MTPINKTLVVLESILVYQFQIVSPRDIGRMLKRTPEISYYAKRHESESDPTFLRGLGNNGVLTYSEYLFLLSVITKPNSGLKFAFSIIDVSKENTIMGDEFSKVSYVEGKI